MGNNTEIISKREGRSVLQFPWGFQSHYNEVEDFVKREHTIFIGVVKIIMCIMKYLSG